MPQPRFAGWSVLAAVHTARNVRGHIVSSGVYRQRGSSQCLGKRRWSLCQLSKTASSPNPLPPLSSRSQRAAHGSARSLSSPSALRRVAADAAQPARVSSTWAARTFRTVCASASRERGAPSATCVELFTRCLVLSPSPRVPATCAFLLLRSRSPSPRTRSGLSTPAAAPLAHRAPTNHAPRPLPSRAALLRVQRGPGALSPAVWRRSSAAGGVRRRAPHAYFFFFGAKKRK